MKKRKVKEFVTLIPGINPTRAQEQFAGQKINYYDRSSFDADCSHEDIFPINEVEPLGESTSSLNAGDVVINNSLQLATRVGNSNVGKVLSINFTKVEFHNNQLDKDYFLFMFNTYKDVKRQKDRELQGTGLILRLPLRAIGEITIPIVSLKEQQRIGQIYIETMKLQSRLNRYSNLIEQFTNSVIEDTLQGGED